MALDPPDQTGAAFGLNTPFEEQLAFFRRKLNLPTDRWDDIKRAAHDRAFIVAGAAKADLLQDLRAAVDQSVQGGSLGSFRRDFKAVVAKHGWTGWRGEGSTKGIAWRTRVIHQTNMATSYAAGQWAQMTEPEYAAERPFWRYVHADGVLHPRPLHLAWHNTVLPNDHPFWRTHFAPNGWGCRCEVWAEKAPKAGDNTQPPEGWQDLDPKTGAPLGIDKGFDYAPGANATTPLQTLVDQKLLDLAAPIGAAMAQTLQPALALERQLAWTTMVDRVADTKLATGEVLLATVVQPPVVAALANNGVELDNAAIWLRDSELLHALRDAKSVRGTGLPQDVWRRLPELLATARTYLDTADTALVYELDLGPRVGKVVVRVNYNAKGRFDGERASITSNFIQTGGWVAPDNLAKDKRYVLLGA